MKLRGSKYHEINYHMASAKEMKRGNIPVNVYLSINPKENIKKVKADLQNGYDVKVLDYWEMINTLNVELPSKNLRKVVTKDYVEKYDFPGIVEVLGLTEEKEPRQTAKPRTVYERPERETARKLRIKPEDMNILIG